uniref:uncharacterized protein C18orf63-like n=1 Tax=Solea senegalensis TaxID=28829 RepID=UPI001CD840B3|nr:uncharacterized protein C18orf63-like [Solea senegalensis]
MFTVVYLFMCSCVCRMSGGVETSLFFLSLPDLKKLLSVSLSLQEDEDEPRSRQLKICRDLVLLYSDVLVSPALDSFTDITVVMAIPFFQKGILQAFGQRHCLQVGCPQQVSPGVLQCFLSYSLITRLTPRWNKAGRYLISGKDFLTHSGRLNAVSMELTTTDGHLCLNIETNTVRLPPTTLQDFDLPPSLLKRFWSDPDFVLDPSSTGGTVWCHVLPSMKKGQIITISRQLSGDGPFRTYRDLQNHWNRLYGYRLPELAEGEEVYCSVYFRLVGERLFTYPLSCIRLQPVQRCPRVDLQGVLASFLSDIREQLKSVCGFPAHLTRKPRYCTTTLNSPASSQQQVLSGEQVNLTSTRHVLTHPTPPPPPPVRSQPLVWSPLSQQDRAEGILGSFTGLTQSQRCGGLDVWPSSSHSSSSLSSCFYSSQESFFISDSVTPESAPSLSPIPSSSLPPFLPASSLLTATSSSSSSFLPFFQPASSLTSSSLLPPPPLPPPKLVPIFKNKHPSRHVNVTLLRAQKQREHQSGGGGGGEGEERRMTLPAFRNNTPAPPPPGVSHPLRPPPIIPNFQRCPKLLSSSNSAIYPPPPQPSAHPTVKTLSSLSPKPGLVLTPEMEMKLKSMSSSKPSVKFSSDSSRKQTKQEAPETKPPRPPTSSDIANRDTPLSSRVVKKNRAAAAARDVEKMARNNQLSKLKTLTLLTWLKGRGVVVSAKHKKEELMLKVMACLAEA